MPNRELSVFVDESGDEGETSRYYLLALVFHEQDLPIGEYVYQYERLLTLKSLGNIPLHLNPLMRGNEDYRNVGIESRKKYLSCFRIFEKHLPFTYHVFAYRKSEMDGSLEDRLRRDLVNFLFDHLDYFQRFDHVKIYYDDGQKSVTRALRESFDYALAHEASIYRDASSKDYTLLQLADYVCGLELTALKYERGEQTKTDVTFFGAKGNFKKNWLKKARRHLLA